MGSAPITTFAGQLYRYVASITALVKDLFRFNPVLMIKVLVLSGAGTTLQGFALGSTFFILRHLKNGLYVEVGKILPAVDARVHCALLLAGVLAVLGVAVFLLYMAEKCTFKLSKSYANKCGADLITDFPVVTSRIDNPAIHLRTGLPLALIKEIRMPCSRLEIAVRTLMRSPISFFQVIYGAGFLLYLEPRLTLIIFVVAAPILVPLNRLTRTVKDAEKQRIQTSKYVRKDAEFLIHESGRLPITSNQADARVQGLFDASAFAVANHYRYIRVVGQAGARAVAISALMIAGIVSMLYFWMVYSDQGLPIALIVVYFGALRLAVMSGRQVVARLAAFARFYDQVQKLFGDRLKVARQEEVSGTPRIFGIKGPDLAQDSAKDLTVEGNGPFAIVGTFPLLPINRYAVAVVLPRLNKRRRAAVVSRMAFVHEDPDLHLDLTWRAFLGINAAEDTNAITKNLQACCHLLDARQISRHLDKPLNEFRANGIWSHSEAIEAVLLRAYFLAAPVVVAREAALARLSSEAVDHWKQMLKDRLLLIYYQYDKQPIGRWGEPYVALIGSGAKDVIGVAPVEWANADPRRIMAELTGRLGDGEGSWEEPDWDDDFDDA